jgi:hypothetical protein
MRKEYIEDLENEVWIINNGYEVSNMGRIIGKKGKLLNCKPNKDGYLQCSITFNDGFHAGSVHRAVAYLFIGKPKDGQEVNHIDGIKYHNYDSNLEWVTKKENQEHEVLKLQQRSGTNNYMNKLTDEKVKEIHTLCKSGTILYKDVAKMYDISPTVVSSIATAIRWRHLGLEPIIIKRGSHYDMRKYTNS